MSNFKAGKVQYSFLETVTAAGTLILTHDSEYYQIFTGSSTHTLRLPNATLVAPGVYGEAFFVVNQSSGSITIQNASSVTIATALPNSVLEIFLNDGSTSAGGWVTYSSGASGAGGMWSVGPGATKKSLARGVFAGGLASSSPVNTIDYIIITTDANAASFGTLLNPTHFMGACASETRGIFAGGDTASGSYTAVGQYITIASTGNAQNFGNLTAARRSHAGCGSNVRGVLGGGFNGSAMNTIDYYTIASAGVATSFGNLSVARNNVAACSSPTRGVFWGGAGGSSTIDYVTIATTGNAVSFGSLATGRNEAAACSNLTTGLCGGGSGGSGNFEKITIATLSNAVAFGLLSSNRGYLASTSGRQVAIFAGGDTGADSNTIDKTSFANGGTVANFGNLSQARNRVCGLSNAHGGI